MLRVKEVVGTGEVGRTNRKVLAQLEGNAGLAERAESLN
jgi:hypothetical protein